MSSHEESHCDDFQDHLHGVNEQEDEIDGSIVFGDTVYLLVQGQEKAVNHDNKQDESIKPGIDCNQLDDLVSERIGNRKAA